MERGVGIERRRLLHFEVRAAEGQVADGGAVVRERQLAQHVAVVHVQHHHGAVGRAQVHLHVPSNRSASNE